MWSRAEASPGHPRPRLLLVPPAPLCSQGLTLIAQLQVHQGVDAANSLLAAGRPQVRTPWGEEANEEAQVVEGHQGLERQTASCCRALGGGSQRRGCGPGAAVRGQVPLALSPRYRQEYGWEGSPGHSPWPAQPLLSFPTRRQACGLCSALATPGLWLQEGRRAGEVCAGRRMPRWAAGGGALRTQLTFVGSVCPAGEGLQETPSYPDWVLAPHSETFLLSSNMEPL